MKRRTPKVKAAALTNQRAKVNLLIRRKRAADKADAEFSKVRTELQVSVQDVQVAAERAGIFETKIPMEGTGSVVEMVLSDQFSALDDVQEKVARKILGEGFNKLFEVRDQHTLKEDEYVRLCDVLRNVGHDPSEFFTEKKATVAKEGFRATRFDMRSHLRPRQNVALDLLVPQLQHKPRLSGIKWARGAKKST